MDVVSIFWIVPFVCVLLSISLFPLLFPKFWEKNNFKILCFFIFSYATAVICVFSTQILISSIIHTVIEEYIPFVALISALYLTSSGVFVNIKKNGPLVNVLFLFFGSVLAGWIGTTGASVLLIKPFLRMNADRCYKKHLVIFYIFLISNIGGAVSPLGDPPLFVGFLKGIHFSWFFNNLFKYTICVVAFLLLLFFVIDYLLNKVETDQKKQDKHCIQQNKNFITIDGWHNIVLMAAILMTTIGCQFDGSVYVFGMNLKYSNILRDVLLISISLISMKITPSEIRQKNEFSFAPLKEVAEIFIAIFITVTPIILLLHKGSNGSLSFIFDYISPLGEFSAVRSFWISGGLSSVLDNAPTFLIFFHIFGGDPSILMASKAPLLISLCLSTVFMGAMTYIGNAPNFMVRSIAVADGVNMPSFVGYMLWSICILGPIFWLLSTFL